MLEIQLNVLREYASAMKNMGCNFKIIAPNGDEFGDLDVNASKKKDAPKAKLRYPKGTIRNYYKPLLDLDAKPGTAQEIPPGEFSTPDIAQGVSALLCAEWGKGTYKITSMPSGVVQIYRRK
jgi:hypothetical protein